DVVRIECDSTVELLERLLRATGEAVTEPDQMTDIREVRRMFQDFLKIRKRGLVVVTLECGSPSMDELPDVRVHGWKITAASANRYRLRRYESTGPALDAPTRQSWLRRGPAPLLLRTSGSTHQPPREGGHEPRS